VSNSVMPASSPVDQLWWSLQVQAAAEIVAAEPTSETRRPDIPELRSVMSAPYLCRGETLARALGGTIARLHVTLALATRFC